MGAANHTRRTRVTPKQKAADAFRRIQDEEAAEYGRSYSGTFASKDGVRIFNVNLTPRQWAVVADVLWETTFETAIPKTKAQSIERRTIERLGEANVLLFAQIMDDKWGPALGLRNKNGDVLFMGMCSE